MKQRALYLLLALLLSVSSVAQERPVPARASLAVPVIHTLQPSSCLQPGGMVAIIGEAFGSRERSLHLLGAKTRLPVEVVRWTDTRIEARLPVAERLRDSRYQLGLTAADGRWLGEPLNRLNVCSPAPRPVDAVSEPPRAEPPPARPQIPAQP
ncbi:MAG TPA: IPT/TIG domain-containing protein, partial [Cellvibrionaceae bacterium]